MVHSGVDWKLQQLQQWGDVVLMVLSVDKGHGVLVPESAMSCQTAQLPRCQAQQKAEKGLVHASDQLCLPTPEQGLQDIKALSKSAAQEHCLLRCMCSI